MKAYINNIFKLSVCCGLVVLLCGTTVVGSKYDSTIDSPLEQIIDALVKQFRPNKGLTHSDRTSFVVYDISRSKKLVSINEDRQMMAASLIKNFVMLVYFHEVKHRRLTHTNKNHNHLKQMIKASSNTSTNYFINLVGGPYKANRILKANYPYFQQTLIVERIPSNGRTYKNKTSAHDLNKFYVQLWHNNLPHSDKMKVYFGLPNGDYIYKKTRIPTSVKVLNKTGTVYGLIGDSGIIVMRDPQGKSRPYVFTGLIEDRSKAYGRRRISFGAWVSQRANVLRRASEKAYGYIYKSYGGRW